MREANISITDEDLEAMGIEDLVSLTQEAGLVDLEELACYGTGAVVQVEVEARIDEAALSTLEYVDRWERVVETDDGHLYIIAFTAPDLPESLAATADDLIGTCDPDLEGGRATMSLVGPQEALAGTIDEYEAAGIAPDLRKLGTYAGHETAVDALTDRQLEVLQTAFDMGYYEVPRKVSTAEIATELELDPSTVGEHLQRAERAVFSRLL